MSFGVNEVLLASVLGAVVFSVAAAQPLVIVGVTGTILEPLSDTRLTCARSHHSLQLHSLRHHGAARHELFCLHVLDWAVWHDLRLTCASADLLADGPS